MLVLAVQSFVIEANTIYGIQIKLGVDSQQEVIVWPSATVFWID